MKKLLIAATLLIAGLTTQAQNSGRISYEAMVKVDLSKMRININGQDMKPGDPGFPAEIPDTRTFEIKTSYNGSNAKEEREGAGGATMIRRTFDGPGGGEGAPGQTMRIEPPFSEKNYLDLAGQKLITVLTVGKEADAKVYKSETPFKKPAGWQVTDQTKKIAGYVCQKATVPYKNENYTVWYTTELPMTYSPVRDLMPEKGVVLAVEGSKEAYKAIKVDLKASVSEQDVLPSASAKAVSPEEMKELREKAMADFRARMFERNN
ncbi:GLPGLI family protein [Arsenicibacter rosenii]|uniref:GLPGLI family protein n=1 Tax=Arsenicibacter rosenii TaxID=1750698 RepID=A0A1S2VI60_9BACT|nr:GLPGLI family protein [Arsenicibacter rosenii]OIN58441.1 hypothetical protein BLX24_15750 [Arsenicibacter rosenii]